MGGGAIAVAEAPDLAPAPNPLDRHARVRLPEDFQIAFGGREIGGQPKGRIGGISRGAGPFAPIEHTTPLKSLCLSVPAAQEGPQTGSLR